MAFTYRISTEAQNDITEAYNWYEKEQSNLGDEFLKSLDTAKDAIIDNPRVFSFRYQSKVRGYLLERFPFIVLYIINDQFIDVISVFHTSQNPQKYEERVV
ncbi:MAG: type II toxin-antitoxin system RelE/ParE family toxin [Balneolaceae bacterium]